MAIFELLVKAEDKRSPDVKKDERAYKAGDVIDIKPAGFKWGREEGPPKFHIIRVDAASIEDLRPLVEPEFEDIQKQKLERLPTGEIVPIIGETELVREMVTRRKVTLDLKGLKKAQKDKLSAGEPLVLNAVDFSGAKKDRTKAKDRK